MALPLQVACGSGEANSLSESNASLGRGESRRPAADHRLLMRTLRAASWCRQPDADRARWFDTRSKMARNSRSLGQP
jgi:hypothetical protein